MKELDIREQEKLTQSFDQADRFVMKNYISEISSYDIVPVGEELKHLSVSEITRLYQLTKIVYDKNENTQDKLSSVFNALAGNKGSLIMVIHSDGKQTDFYIGTKAEPIPGVITSCQKTLEKSFTGNFPGSELVNVKGSHIEEIFQEIFSSNLENGINAISAVSGVASLRDNNKEKCVQGMEKLVDAMRGESFTAVYIADPVSLSQLNEIRQGFENIYTQLTPFATSDLNFSSNESQAVTDGITQGLSESINQSLSKTQSHTENNTTTTNKSDNYGRNFLTSTVVGIFGGKTGSSESTSSTSGYTLSTSEAETSGTTHTESTQKSNSTSVTEGSARSLQIKFENKSVIGLLERIDEQLERIKQCEDFGMWNCAAYFIAQDTQTAKIAANTYKSLMRGANSSVESACVNTWDNKNKQELIQVTEYLKKLHHPLIDLNQGSSNNVPFVTPGSLISGVELAIHAGLPLKSIPGLPVMEAAEFGRNVVTYEQATDKRGLRLGNIFHMGKKEETDVHVDVESLAMHTFVTGSTGSGKSNTLYYILDELTRQGVHFLVIEPAKGEYKNVLGGRKDIRIFGTNPQYTEMLKINPFAFPEDVHVLEHLDRVIEIFNACWPMYAAMPAVLKEAIERIYVEAGWDLEDSVNYNGIRHFPTFRDLLIALPEVIKESAYSQEVKSNYIGSLVTRIRSLTNGIYGRIFSADETDNEVLFDQNCIVDLSRVGSMETKSLIMGILVMRLQEYRVSNAKEMNSKLKHVTVLEEAHNLLRRTSQEQSQESSNLQGKAVEMLSNAIAEMRTYGEGFIIADQSPNLLDLSVIRNTNTKIILRLPDESDRQLVGKASNLNEEQIIELAKLKVGVAVIYQNDWLQPVLCQIDKFENVKPFLYQPPEISDKQLKRRRLGNLTRFLLATRVSEESRIDCSSIDLDEWKKWLDQEDISDEASESIQFHLRSLKLGGNMDISKQENFKSLAKLISELYNGKSILLSGTGASQFEQWNRKIINSIRDLSELNNNQELEREVIHCLLRDQSSDDDESQRFYFNWIEHSMGRELA